MKFVTLAFLVATAAAAGTDDKSCDASTCVLYADAECKKEDTTTKGDALTAAHKGHKDAVAGIGKCVKDAVSGSSDSSCVKGVITSHVYTSADCSGKATDGDSPTNMRKCNSKLICPAPVAKKANNTTGASGLAASIAAAGVAIAATMW